MKKQKPKKEMNYWMRYASLGTQMLVSLAVSVFMGFKADKWLQLPFPVLAWLLPLLVLIVIFYQIIKETTNKNE